MFITPCGLLGRLGSACVSAASDLCKYTHICTNNMKYNSNLINCAVWFWYLLSTRDKRYLFPRYHSSLTSALSSDYLQFVLNIFSDQAGSGGSVEENTLDYQSRDHKLDPPLFWSFGWDFKTRSRRHMTSLLVGLKLEFTHSDQATQTCFWTYPCSIRFAVLTPRMLNKIVQQCVSQSLSMRLTTCVSAHPRLWYYLSETQFLTRLRSRFPVTILTMFWYYH